MGIQHKHKMSKVNDSNTPKEEEKQKEIPINKYSIYEIKSAIDTKITEYLENQKFQENHFLSNVKLTMGTICLIFTAVAYLNNKPFPDNYNIILVSTIGYWVCSLLHYLF